MDDMAISSPRTLPLAQTKDRLGECVRAVEKGQNIVITRHGKAVAALISPEDLGLLTRLRAADRGRGLAGLAGGWPGSGELVKVVQTRRRTSGRRFAA